MAENKKNYKVGLYIRLSKEDENKRNRTDDSESVKNQREYLNDFIKIRNTSSKNEYFMIFKEYIDDGCSGTNTKDRAAFNEMIDDVKKGKINCIIVKDLSRFARNNSDQTFYLNNFFPEHKTRFISVLDNYDNVNKIYSEFAEILGVLNEQRSRKMSSNIKNTFTVKAKNGEFIGAFPSYGYKRDPKNKNHLIIDEEAAEVVKRIFNEYLCGVGQVTIANRLNKEGIPCPSEYKHQKGLNYHNSNLGDIKKWTYSTVHNILKNKMLCGDMWQKRNKNGKFDRGSRKYDDSENILVKNTHEAIIPKKDFELVQQRLKSNRDISEQLKHNVSIYAGHIRCECGQPMSKITNKYKGKITVRYVCRSYKTGEKSCTSHQIFEDELNEIILVFLNDCIGGIKQKNEIIKKAAKSKNTKQNIIAKQLNSAKRELSSIDTKKKRLLDLYIDGSLEKNDYIAKKEELEKNKENLKKTIMQLSKQDAKTQEELFLADPIIKQLLDIGEFTALTKEIIDTFIDRIIVHEEAQEISIEIIPTFKNNPPA